MKNLLLICSAFTLFITPIASAQQSGMPIPGQEPLLTSICMTCHGAYGQGNPVVGGPRLACMQSWYLKNQLESFRNGWRGSEQDYLPAYEMRETAAALTETDINQLMVMLEAWEAEPAADTITGDISKGQELYQQCTACHGADAMGNELLAAPALADQNDWYLLSQLKLFKSGYRGSHPEDVYGLRMQVVLPVLNSEQDMIDVLAYINSID